MSHDEMIMALVARRDKLEAENESLKRKLIMYTPDGKRNWNAAYDRLVAERNELEGQLREAKDTIVQLLSNQ